MEAVQKTGKLALKEMKLISLKKKYDEIEAEFSKLKKEFLEEVPVGYDGIYLKIVEGITGESLSLRALQVKKPDYYNMLKKESFITEAHKYNKIIFKKVDDIPDIL